jgi:hypothetical protein
MKSLHQELYINTSDALWNLQFKGSYRKIFDISTMIHNNIDPIVLQIERKLREINQEEN